MAFNLEDLIRWEELSNSLQDRFRNIESMARKNYSVINSFINNYDITIGYDPPLNPKGNQSMWFDLNYDVLRFYMDKNGGTNYKWEITRGAWYGGSSDDPVNPAIPGNTGTWQRMCTLAWGSNLAKNNRYTTTDEADRIVRFSAPVSGTYKIEDHSFVFPYNAQNTYTHDGGRITITLVKATLTSSGGYTNSTVYTASYDSRGKFEAKDSNGNYPTKEISMRTGDRLYMQVTTNANLLSTDELEIIQIASVYVYLLPSSKKYDDPYKSPNNLNSGVTGSDSGGTCHCYTPSEHGECHCYTYGNTTTKNTTCHSNCHCARW